MVETHGGKKDNANVNIPNKTTIFLSVVRKSLVNLNGHIWCLITLVLMLLVLIQHPLLLTSFHGLIICRP